MKFIQYIDGIVVDIRTARNDATNNNTVIVDSIPKFEPREGFNGVLKYSGSDLYWDYEEVQESDELSDSEALDIILGGHVE